jgi:hypothetical protein
MIGGVLRFASLVLFAISLALFCALPASGMQWAIQAESQIHTAPGSPTQRTALERMEKIGLRRTRVTLSWKDVAARCGVTAVHRPRALSNPNAACYNWTMYDGIVKNAKRHRIGVLFSVRNTPEWLDRKNGVHQGLGYVGTSSTEFAKFRLHYSRFAHAAALRYPGVRYWTIWNEPNGDYFWKPLGTNAPERYGSLFIYGARAIRSANSNAYTVPGPTATSGQWKPGVSTYIRRVQATINRAGAGSLVSAWAHNPYPSPKLTPDQPVPYSEALHLQNLDKLIAILDESPVTRGKPIWATEFAYESKPDDPNAFWRWGQHAMNLADSYRVLWLSHRVTFASWYVLQDPTRLSDWQSGLYSASGQAKYARAMYARMISPWRDQAGQTHLWGRSSPRPSEGKLIWSRSPDGPWQDVPGQTRAADGALQATWTLGSGTYYVACRDSIAKGYIRQMIVP